jgi:hypothetical protein
LLLLLCQLLNLALLFSAAAGASLYCTTSS